MILYKSVLIDLDGTISDPKIGITKSVQYALQKMGVDAPNIDELECFIGPPLQVSFAEHFQFDDQDMAKAIAFYRERFKEKGMFEQELYVGMLDLLEALKKQGCRLLVATSKPTLFAEEILKFFNMEHYFDYIVGSNLDGTRIAKTEIIQYILNKYSGQYLAEFVMIGDREHDLIGANNVGIDAIGVTYGYGSYAELSACQPKHIVASVSELKNLLIGSGK